MKLLQRVPYRKLQLGDVIAIGNDSDLYRLVIAISRHRFKDSEFGPRPIITLRPLLESGPDYEYGYWFDTDLEDWTIIRPEGEPAEWLAIWHSNQQEETK